MSKTKWHQKPIYLLIALALVLSLGIAAVPMAGTVGAALDEVWVCPTGDCGHPGAQYASIQDGIDAVSAPGTVHVAAGAYNESITLKGGVQVLGAGADVTTINGGGTDSVVRGSGVGSTTKLDGFTITNGSATYGGGIYLYNNSSPTISNCIFSGNSASQYGGGMSNHNNSSPTVTNCTFWGNSATSNGGGMSNYQYSSPQVTNCTFSGNSASNGGGMYNWYSSPTVTNCTFSGNSATSNGGGMCNYDSCSPAVTDCSFEGNSAVGGGGGMFNLGNSSPTVTNCIFSGNSATYGTGGGMYNWYSSPNVTNCIFWDNSAVGGGGMYNLYSSPTVTNCIFWDNSATTLGGGIFADVISSPKIDYNDVWNNSPGDYYGCSPGPHDISQDPMFVNPAAHDYHSMPGSPCIDAGTNDGAPSDDIEGNPRPIDGDGDGWAITDMGAYEYVPPPPPAHFSYLHSEGSLIDLAHPVGTQWHELWPVFCKEYHLSSWQDNGDGVLSRCDWIDMYQKPDGEVEWYHVENVTITLCLTHNETGEPKYIDLEGGYDLDILTNPVGTRWHEIYPAFCREYELSSWNDTDEVRKLDFCDTIELTDKETGEVSRWHVEDVATDIVVTLESPPPPPPVGGEVFPVSKVALLIPWIALAALLAGGTGWYVLRRRRAQS